MYVEFKLHSKTVYEENGDIWVLFPKIKNGKVIDLVAGLLTENETEVYYITLDKTSSLFLKNVDLYQKAFNKYFKIFVDFDNEMKNFTSQIPAPK